MKISTDKQLELLKELKERLNAFSLLREFSQWILVFVLLGIGVIVAIALGELLFFFLVIGLFFLFEFLGIKLTQTVPTRSDIAHEICSLMDECLAEDPENNRKIGEVILSTVSIYDNNRPLYRRFIARFPEMKSFKLWYISGYKGSP